MMQQLGKSTVLLIAVLLTTLNVYGQVIIEQEDIPTEPGILQPFFSPVTPAALKWISAIRGEPGMGFQCIYLGFHRH